MFMLAVLIEWVKRLVALLPERKPLTKVQKVKRIAQGMKYFEKGVKIVVGIFAVLWIMFIIVVKHLLKVIWEFK
ncbi:hypothetical protein SEA_EFFIE_750 [Acinetobacter phage Effie]|nr:hypothetical protein SEA_EFFIE_10 [Acinetobacter phage Effie]QXO06690.1 hypothetical protein SEA_EFFIE_750 [Acinetobacter phage Effie]